MNRFSVEGAATVGLLFGILFALGKILIAIQTICTGLGGGCR